MLTTLWGHRSLVWELTKREFTGRYRGSFGGVLWAFAQPLFLLSVYTIAFGVILKSRWDFAGSTADYALILFAGLIIYNMFAEVLIKSTTLVASNPNFVKKVVFPLELLPIIGAASAVIHAVIALVVWLFGYILLFGLPKAVAFSFPLVFIAFIPVLLGLGWLLSSVGVLVRDLGQFTGMINQMLLFLTPVFYSIDAAPVQIQVLLRLNPLSFIVEQLRAVLFFGNGPDLLGLAFYFGLGSIFAYCALLLFRRLRPSFADMV